jgi:two-component system, NarL family, invasion response regulator UvrY
VEQRDMHILIADDFSAARRRLKEILEDSFPDAQFSEAANSEEIMRQLANAVFNLLLLDIDLPGRNGIEVLKDVQCVYPQLPVFIVSLHSREQYAARCLAAGAAAYINKEQVLEDLIPEVEKILPNR